MARKHRKFLETDSPASERRAELYRQQPEVKCYWQAHVACSNRRFFTYGMPGNCLQCIHLQDDWVARCSQATRLILLAYLPEVLRLAPRNWFYLKILIQRFISDNFYSCIRDLLQRSNVDMVAVKQLRRLHTTVAAPREGIPSLTRISTFSFFHKRHETSGELTY